MSLSSSLLLPAFQFINSVVVCSFSFRFRVCARRSPSTSGFNAFPRTFSFDVIYTLLTERQASAGRCGSVFNKPPVGTYTNIFPLCVRNAPLVSTLYLFPSENVRRLFSVYLCCNVHVIHQFAIAFGLYFPRFMLSMCKCTLFRFCVLVYGSCCLLCLYYNVAA